MGSTLSRGGSQQATANATQFSGGEYNTTGIENISNETGGADTTIVSTNQQPALGSSYNIDELSNSPNEFNGDNNNSFDLNNSTARQHFRNTTSTIGNDGDFNFNLFGTVIYPFRWMTLPTLYSWLGPISSLAMIFGCVLPYVPQYMTIYKNRNCQGFSTFVCLTLLIANILRVAFWFGHPFEMPLLVQSALMIVAQILLLELCVRIKRQNGHIKNRSLFSSSPRYFWRWTNLISYLEFLILFSALLAAAMYKLIHCETFVEVIGYCALVTESMLGLPQVIKNYNNRSVDGMSLSMVLMWFGGDTFKTGYFIANKTPFQFWLCGLLQITIDLIILFQVFLFRQNAPMKVSVREKELSNPKEMMAL